MNFFFLLWENGWMESRNDAKRRFSDKKKWENRTKQ